MTLLSLIISLISVVVAIVAAVYAKRNTEAAFRSARAGERSANESQRSREVAEAATLHSVHRKTLEEAPKFYLAVESTTPIATMDPAIGDEGEDVSSTPLEAGMRIRKRYLDLRSVHFDVYGVMQNRDVDPIYISGFGWALTFLEGESDLCHGTYRLPAVEARGRYVLAPDQAVRFRWRVETSVEQWLDIAKAIRKDWGPIGWIDVVVWVSHAIEIDDARDQVLKVTLTAMHSPVYVEHGKDDVLVVGEIRQGLDDVSVQGKVFARIPDSVEDLRPRRS